MRRRAGERGAATAELAMTLPILVAVTVALVWLLTVGIAELRTVDAARETARALARGDAQAAAVAAGVQVGVAGTALDVRRSGRQVVVEASARVAEPAVLRFLGGVRLHATATAEAETP